MPDKDFKPIKGSARVANVLTNLKQSGMVPHYTPEAVGAETHTADEPGVIWVDVDHILDSPYQHQEQLDPENLQALVESIKSEGFLAALNVNTHAKRAGYYVLTAGGHQRRDAAKAAGLSRIPVFVEPTLDPLRLAYRAAKENAIRVNTSPVNLGLLFLQMQDDFNLTQEQIADELHKGRNFVKFCIMAARSAPDIQRMLQAKPDSLRAMTYLRRLDAEEERAPIIELFLAGELTTEGVQAAVEDRLQRLPPVSTREGPEQGASGDSHKRLTLPSRPLPNDGHDVLDPPDGRDSAEEGFSVHAIHHPDEERAVDPQIAERLGKLKGVISRFETYERALGTAQLSSTERDVLAELVNKGNKLLELTSRPHPEG